MTDNGRQILEAKLALERELLMPLYLVGRQYIKAWEASGGSLPEVQRRASRQRLELVLQRHYARVVLVMTGRKPPKTASLSAAALSLRHMQSLTARATNGAMLILAGIDRDLARAQAADTATEAETGIPVSVNSAFLALETKDKVRGVTVGYALRVTAWVKDAISKLKTRLPTISNIETQSVGEEARFEYVADQMADGDVMHSWHNVGDAHVRHPPRSRFDHVSPEGQTVPVRVPFEVSGQLLRFPGDMSLGASIGNIAGCRCYTRFFLRKFDGSETEIYVTPSAPARRMRAPTDKPSIGDNRPAYNPTSAVTLNGNTRARVILGNGELATLRQEAEGLVTVRVRGETVARARFSGGHITELQVSPQHRDADIEGLIRRSVERSSSR